MFVLVAAAFAWGVAGMGVVVVVGLDLSGSDPRPQAVLWAVAYLTAYVVVYQTDVSVLE